MKKAKISFDILDSCVDFPTSILTENLFNLPISKVKITQTNIEEWKATYNVIAELKEGLSEEQVEQTALELRERIVALFALVSDCDVSVTDEINIILSSEKKYINMERGGARNIQKRISFPIKLGMKKSILINATNLEWHALTRFKDSIMSNSNPQRFEALVGTIDTLGKIEYPRYGVSKRMSEYMKNNLHLGSSDIKLIVKHRHKKIHENEYSKAIYSTFLNVKNRVSDDLWKRFGFLTKKPPLQIDGMKIYFK